MTNAKICLLLIFHLRTAVQHSTVSTLCTQEAKQHRTGAKAAEWARQKPEVRGQNGTEGPLSHLDSFPDLRGGLSSPSLRRVAADRTRNHSRKSQVLEALLSRQTVSKL